MFHCHYSNKTDRREAGLRAVAARNRRRIERAEASMAELERELAATEKAIVGHRRRPALNGSASRVSEQQ